MIKIFVSISEGPSPQFLQYVMVPIIPNSVCNSQADYKIFGYNVSDGQLCGGNITSGGVDSCSGDSGGPLICDAGGFLGHVLTGVVSLGYKCGEPNFPGIYTRVTYYIDWIKSKMGESTSSHKDTHYLYQGQGGLGPPCLYNFLSYVLSKVL